MRFGWGRKNLTPIGIDFGHDSIKLLQIVDEDPPRLAAAAQADVAEEARRDAQAYRRFAVQAVADLLRQGGFKGKRAIASINSAEAYVQHVRLDGSEGGGEDQQIQAELRARLPLDPAGLVIRSVPVGDVFADGQSQREVICLAASRELVLNQVSALRSAGLKVVGMHCEPMAVLAAFSHLFRRANDASRTTLFVDIGASSTKAAIAHGRDLVFAKTIQVGGDHLTHRLADRRGISVADARAERFRRAQRQAAATERDTPPPGQVQAPSERRRSQEGGGMRNLEDVSGAATELPNADAGSSATGTAESAAEPEQESETLEALVDELHLCVGYHSAMFQDRPVDKAVFVGGEARHVDLCQRVARGLGLPAQLGDPLARLIRPEGTPPPVGVDLRQSQAGWAVPMGLCRLPSNL